MTDDPFRTEPVGGVGRATLTLLLDQEFDSGTLYALRAAVQAHAGRAGLSEDRAGEVVLAVHELAANAIAHGAGHGRLRMWDLAGTLSCEIVDSGRASRDDSSRASRDDSSRASRDDSGRASRDGPPRTSETADPWPTTDGHGLWLVRQVADQLDLRSGPRGTRAVVTFAPPPSS
jgi:anti-sigma regulatory factor (Ser/Thr protein kinase)